MSTGLAIFTFIHVAISLVAIVAGFVVLYGLLTQRSFKGWTKFFLVTTVATSATGFGFPVDHFMPSHAISILSLLILALAIYALYSRQLAGVWRPVYVMSAVAAFYLNFFVLIVQSFMKVPALKALAPTQTEAPFAIVQVSALLAFVVAGVLATIRYRP